MKSITYEALLASGRVSTGQSESPPKLGVSEQMVLQRERDWDQANAKKYLPALDRILAPEFA